MAVSVRTRVVMVGLVPTIQRTSGSGACRWMDPRDKPEDDTWISGDAAVVGVDDCAARGARASGSGPIALLLQVAPQKT